jgi:conjugal transfer pilus assembly protein TraB
VSHNGSALAKAALASTLSGLGNAAQAAAQTQMVSPIGTTTTINPNQAFGSALAGGVGGGFNTLSQYYTNMLNQITPAIEVSSGRHVDVILQDGAELKESLGKPVMSNDSQLPLNELNR